ncbi:MAG: DUF4332 domain-containing protein [Planctomycetaceae bacterium]
MQLTNLTIDGFGVLGDVRIDDLQPGLNVIHGPNGSGKTTLLHFLRGVWCGFDEARRRRFIPPLASGHPGGSVDLARGERRYHVTRQALPNGTDRLAVSIRRGTLDDTASVRSTIETLAPDLVHLLYAVTGSDSHALDQLLERAKRDGISLQSQRRKSTRFDDRLSEIRTRRTALLGGEGTCGETERLRAACRESAAELARLKDEADRLRDQLAARYDEVMTELDRLARRVEWLDLERQGLQSNLIETEGRTVAGAPRIPAPVENSVVLECHPHDDLQARIREIDQRMAHARAVLEDLARSRLQVSVETAQIVGVEPRDLQENLARQRAALRSLEREVLQLRDTAQQLAAPQICHCSELNNRVQQSIRSMQQQIYLVCQQLSHQEQAHRQYALFNERSQLDSCEAELVEHIARLQRERSTLLDAAHEPGMSALRHQSHLESQACVCGEHHHFAERATTKVRLQVAPVAVEPTWIEDPRRPGWKQRLAELTDEFDRTKAAWRAAIALRSEWDLERSRLIVLERRIAEQGVEVDQRERRLGQCLDEGQSLLLVEAGLERMRDSVYEDDPAQVIAEASQLLAELTGDRYRALQVTANPLEISAVNDTGLAIPSQALSRGMLDQVGLCLRIALSDEYARRGVDLPLVFDDVLSDSDPDRVDIAIHLIQRVAQHRQVLFLTCQEHLATRFEAAGVEVRDFPGTRRTRSLPVTTTTATSVPTIAPQPLLTSQPAQVAVKPTAASASLHPGSPHWLDVTSPVSEIPSLGEQMARRLAAAGVRTIGDLVSLDPEETILPIDSLQIAPSQWRIWQAEGRLLTCVPQLNRRDAQLLAACGIMLPQELAECDADSLVRRIDRLRGDGRSGWVVTGFVWPDRNTVSQWIANGRRARTFREACESSGWSFDGGSRSRGRTGRRFRVDQPSSHRGLRLRRRLGQRRRATAQLGGDHSNDTDGDSRPSDRQIRPVRAFERVERDERQDSQDERPVDTAGTGELRFYLGLQSPVVDAPSIGPTTARRLEKVGVLTVADLLNREAQQIADRLQHRRITADIVREWQDQSRLMCQVPELRGHDVQVLVACGLRNPDEVARLSAQALFAIVGPFVATKDGQRLLRSAKTPDLAEVTDWITWAQQARVLKAA